MSRKPARRRKYIFVADFCRHLLLVLVQQPKELDWCSLMSIFFFFCFCPNYNKFFDFFETEPCPPFCIPNFLYVLYFVNVCNIKNHPFFKIGRNMYSQKRFEKKKHPETRNQPNIFVLCTRL